MSKIIDPFLISAAFLGLSPFRANGSHLLVPVFFSVLITIRSRHFHFDYLATAELFLVVLVGAGLLVWAALRARSYRKPLIWSLGIAIGLLVIGQALAVATGLASGETEAGGIEWVIVLATIAGYTLAVLAMGVAGLLLLRKLFKTTSL